MNIVQFCDGCMFLNMGEAVQKALREKTGIHHYHKCLMLGIQLKHEDAYPRILRLEECKEKGLYKKE